jgi:hypothetical protein
LVAVESSTVATSTAVASAAEGDNSFGGGDSPFGAEDSPFGAEDSPFGEVTESSEFDGFEAGGGWLWSVRGWIGTSYQAFLHPDFDETKDRHFNKVGVRFSLTGKLGSELRVRTVALLEADTLEQRLHRAIVEEGFVEYAHRFFEVRLGWDALTWGAASTLNIIDIVNTRDLTEGVLDAPKVGQPMLALRFPYETHSLSLLYLTPFVISNFPRLDSAFVPFSVPLPPGAPLPRLGDTVVYGGAPGIWHPQAAARLALSFPGFDIRGTYFYGYSRVPIIEPSTLALVYPLIHHASTDGQVLIGQTAIKWELASVWTVTTDNIRDPGLINPATMQPVGRIPIPGHRFVWIVGIEHTFEGLIGQTRLTPVVEFVGDSSSTWFTDEPRPDILSAFTANHLVYGFDWSFENSVGSTVRFVDLWDLANPADHAMLIEYSERWFEHFTFDIGVRWVVASDQNITAGLQPLSGVYTGLKLNY